MTSGWRKKIFPKWWLIQTTGTTISHIVCCFTQLWNSFRVQGTVGTAQSPIFIIIMALVIQSFHILSAQASAISTWFHWQVLLPILFTMLVASGVVASTALCTIFLATSPFPNTPPKIQSFRYHLSAVLNLVTMLSQRSMQGLASFISVPKYSVRNGIVYLWVLVLFKGSWK